MMREMLLEALAGRTERALDFQTALTAFRACGPDNGGPGEWDKAEWVESTLRAFGVGHIEHVDSPDPRVAGGKRPNLIIRVPGASRKTLWILGHLDVVPPGDTALWDSDPWTVIRDAADPDLIRGRGVEDNQQAVVAGMLIAAELAEKGVTPDLSLGLVLISDEETGNRHGIEYLMRQRPNLIAPGDLVVVPDFGSADGALLEVAEKGVMWVKVTLLGKQCHASTPDEGINTLVAAADMILAVKNVQDRFNAIDELFLPAFSTLTPTRHDANVPNVNTLPGKDVFYIDCRVLPVYPLEEVMDALRELGREIESRHHVQVSLEIVNIEPVTKATPVDSEVVRRLTDSVRSVYGIECRPGGVGGATVAGCLRLQGIPAAVWARLIPNCHQPNEASRLSCAVGDARVFANLLFH